MNVEIIGIVAGVLSCTTFLPQVIKTYRSKSTDDVSLLMFIIAALGSALWLLYGILIQSFALTFTNVIVLVFSLIMLFFKVKYRES
ncbi:MAG: SemiSWEET transporter [Bacteroidales bacterium]|nr:SemiSWEET transporter [Bacteroidales bacterium]